MVDRSYRTLLLGIILIGILGLQAELLLLDHADSFTQWIPHFTLLVGLLSVALVFFKPTALTIKFFRAVMAAFMAIGVLGLYLHYSGNVEFALERSPDLSGFALIWKALHGATPALAPGALAQLGLLGLLYTYRYPSGHVD
ncbi:MAG: hypothetical protein H0W69_10055 [Gemmatimonadaceae bacterium]|nr:hypothetical protein [Gemmatimonadaceae bacterium]